MSKYFSEFYRLVFPYLTGYNVEDFYGQVFSWYQGDSASGDKPLDKSLLERWARGERDVPRKILIQALNEPNIAAGQYDTSFFDLDEKIRKASMESYVMLSNSLKTFMASLPITVSFDDDCLLLTKVFVTSLVCDGILGEERLIEAGLRSAIKKKIAACKKDNYMFSTMYILEILLKSPNRLLGHMLELCPSIKSEDGEAVSLKTKWVQKVSEYVEKEKHKEYLTTALEDINLLQQAKLLAYSTQSKSRVAGELEICKAIVRCDDASSTAIRSLKADLGEMADPAKWDALADECYEKMYRTSI